MMQRTWDGILVIGLLLAAPRGVAGQAAPGGPGDLPTWTGADKNGIGTALSAASKAILGGSAEETGVTSGLGPRRFRTGMRRV